MNSRAWKVYVWADRMELQPELTFWSLGTKTMTLSQHNMMQESLQLADSTWSWTNIVTMTVESHNGALLSP